MHCRRWFCGLLTFVVLCASDSAWSAVLSIAHRGNALYAPENTLAAFLAAEGKADWVETDIRVSRDGELVVMHDATVDRTTDGTGSIAALTFDQLRQFDAGSWFSSAFAGERIPTLEEMITRTLPFATPLLEHKAGTAAAYVAELRRLDVVTNVVVQSFDWVFLASVHALEPNLRLCGLGSGTLTEASLTTLSNAGADTVAWEKSSVTAAELALVHGRGLRLLVWTVDSPSEIQSLIALGVDGIISNDPAAVQGQPQVVTNAPTHLGDRLMAYWKFDDGLTDAFSTTVADSAGANGATLVRKDSVSHWFDNDVAKLGGCLKLEGASVYVTLPSSGGLDVRTNAMTISAWVWLPSLPSQLSTSYGAIFDSTTDCYVLYLDRSNKELRFKVTDVNGHAARPGIPEALLRTNQWLHVAATFSGQATAASGRTLIYLNGQSADTHTGSDSSSPVGLTGSVKTGQAAAMGREGPTGGNYFHGMVDEVALWRRSLSSEEVQQLYEGGQNAQSLDDLLRLPTPLIEFSSIGPGSVANTLELGFRNLGPWRTFKLVRADTCTGTFHEVEDLVPIALGGGDYRFVWPRGDSGSGCFRIRGE